MCWAGGDPLPCFRDGTVGCTLYYKDLNVTSKLPIGQTVRICNISRPEQPGAFDRVAHFPNPRLAQRRALQALLAALNYGNIPVPENYCNPAAYAGFDSTYGAAFQNRWVKNCSRDGIYVTDLDTSITTNIRNSPVRLPSFGAALTSALIALERLETLWVVVNNGTLPSQLGALSGMRDLSIRYYCASGPLPENWIRGWRNISYIQVQPYEDAQGIFRENEECGIIGNVPMAWGVQNLTSLSGLDLRYNQLSGQLPSTQFLTLGWLQTIWLQHNRFTGQVPYSWADLAAKMRASDDPNIQINIDVSYNQLSGLFPKSWQRLGYDIYQLALDGNEQLSGCVPLSAFTTVTFAGTQMTGVCASSRAEVEYQQNRTLLELLPKVLNARGEASRRAALSGMLAPLKTVKSMRELIMDGASSKALFGDTPGGQAWYKITISLIDTTAYATAIEAQGAGLDLSLLSSLAAKLPQLQRFVCRACTHNSANATAHTLPADLAQLSPMSLSDVELTQSQLVGPIPSVLGAWPTLKRLHLQDNRLSGPLPGSFSGMVSLQTLNLTSNQLTGTLPESLGLANLPLTELYLGNNRLTGTIPASWAAFSLAYIGLDGNSISGCIPDGLQADTYNLPWCSAGNLQIQALLELAKLLNVNVANWDVSKPGASAGPRTPPAYCRTWAGVSCDASFNVIGLDLTILQLSAAPRQLSPLVKHLASLPYLQTLNLSGLGLQGSLPTKLSASTPGLQQFNISSNPGVSGTLPMELASLTSLQVLDLSGCSISGTLPMLYAALQKLRVFRAAGRGNAGGLTGQLPASFGLLKNLEELDLSGNGLSGSLPSTWADRSSLLKAATITLVQAKEAAAAAAATAASVASSLATEKASAGPAVAAAAACRSAACRAALARHYQAQGAAVAAQRTVKTLAAMLSSEQQAVSAAFDSSVHVEQRLYLTKLHTLRLNNNAKLAGSLPVVFASLPQLRVLDLSVELGRGGLNGTLPPEFGLMQQLQVLRLAGHQLAGQLPDDWAMLDAMVHINLSHNCLNGPLSPLWASMDKLQEIDLSDNALAGELPGLWSSWRNAITIDVSNNKLSGTVPQSFFDMAGASYHLRCLALFGNTNLTNLEEAQQAFVNSRVHVVTDPAGPTCQ